MIINWRICGYCAALSASILLGTASITLLAEETEARSFRLINRSSRAIVQIFVTDIDEPASGSDLLGPFYLPLDASKVIRPATKRGYCLFDVAVTFSDGNTNTITRVNLCAAKQLEFTDSGHRVPKGDALSRDVGPVLPSRAFLPPHDIPPEDFAAYGIVAFPAKATPNTTGRHIAICEAFSAALPASSSWPVPSRQQMVTVWPVDHAPLPVQLARNNPDCAMAVEHYDLPTALTALKQARTQEDYDFSGEGPYLLAWAPASTKGKKGAIVLIGNLSNASTSGEFLSRFRVWRDEIEKKPELWRHGWDEPNLVSRVRSFVDRWGPMIFFVGHAKDKGE